jgi:tetratricopeptide (TPR) repeat protein
MRWPWKRTRYGPADLPNLLAAADSAYRAGRRKKAITFYKAALRVDSDCFDALVNLGAIFSESYTTMGEAAVLMEKARRLRPENEAVLLNLGAILTHLGQLQKAEEALDRLDALSSEYPDLHYNRAQLYYRMGKRREAFLEAQKEVRLHPENPSAVLLVEQMKNIVSDE